jgi:hypothetical protein
MRLNLAALRAMMAAGASAEVLPGRGREHGRRAASQGRERQRKARRPT